MKPRSAEEMAIQDIKEYNERHNIKFPMYKLLTAEQRELNRMLMWELDNRKKRL
ncbi:MAG: hypothetical protein OEY89_01340 [Gammaproteobacteria bacterium]|nr:hypothetical protein [Gammaproteobacteria bacterium]